MSCTTPPDKTTDSQIRQEAALTRATSFLLFVALLASMPPATIAQTPTNMVDPNAGPPAWATNDGPVPLLPGSTGSAPGDDLNVARAGALLDGAHAQSDEILISSVFASNRDGRKIVVPGGIWPSAKFVPPSPASTVFVDVPGGLRHRPGFDIYDLGFGAPYFGNGVTSEMHGTGGDGSDVEFSRVDSSALDKSNKPMISFIHINDNHNANTQGSISAKFSTYTTTSSSGYADNAVFNMYSMGRNYYGGFDVNRWDHTENYGTNWSWDNIQEMYDFQPYTCPPSADHVYCIGRFMNEEDMGGVGPEDTSSAYDPTATTRKMFWITTNHNINRKSDHRLRWVGTKSYHMYQMITVNNPADNGHEWMFYALPTKRDLTGIKDAVSGHDEPNWIFRNSAVTTDGDLSWTCLGPYTYDLGSIISVGGANDPSNGYYERIGTVLEEEGDYIYNAIIDMSKARFDPTTHYHVFARLQPDMYLDLSADGTRDGQNRHLLGYSPKDGLTYTINGRPSFRIGDDEHLSSNGIATLSTGMHSTLSAATAYPARGMTIGTNLWGGRNDSDVLGGAGGLMLGAVAGQHGHPNPTPAVEIRNDNRITLYGTATFKNGLVVDGGYFQERLSTPLSPSAPCSAGQFTDDTDNHYVCVAPNRWKEVRLVAMRSDGIPPGFPAFTRHRLPTSGLTDGAHARCSDCRLHGRTGVDVVWNAQSAMWTDEMNDALHE